MTVSYPLSLPSSAGIAEIKMTAENVTVMTRSPTSRVQQVLAYPGQQWMATVSMPPMDRDDAEEWVAFLMALKGSAGTFTMGDPTGVTARGEAGGSPLVNGASQTGGTLMIDGATTSQTNWLKAGDYIQLGDASDPDLHKVLCAADTDVGGATTLDIWPDLRSSPADNAAVTVSNTKGLWRLAGGSQSWSYSASQVMYGLMFFAVEAI